MIDWLINKAKQTPYRHLDDYMERYWLVPYVYLEKVKFFERPIAWIFQRFGIAIRIHHILRSDDDRAFHDHPWWYVSIILKGSYTEVTPVFKSGIYQGHLHKIFTANDLLVRRPYSWHRLVLTEGRVWTLFITGPKKQEWGFMPHPRGNKIHHKEYNDGH